MSLKKLYNSFCLAYNKLKIPQTNCVDIYISCAKTGRCKNCGTFS